MTNFGINLSMKNFDRGGIKQYCVFCKKYSGVTRIYNNGLHDLFMDVLYEKVRLIYQGMSNMEDYEYWGFCSIKCCEDFISSNAEILLIDLLAWG